MVEAPRVVRKSVYAPFRTLRSVPLVPTCPFLPMRHPPRLLTSAHWQCSESAIACVLAPLPLPSSPTSVPVLVHRCMNGDTRTWLTFCSLSRTTQSIPIPDTIKLSVGGMMVRSEGHGRRERPEAALEQMHADSGNARSKRAWRRPCSAQCTRSWSVRAGARLGWGSRGSRVGCRARSGDAAVLPGRTLTCLSLTVWTIPMSILSCSNS